MTKLLRNLLPSNVNVIDEPETCTVTVETEDITGYFIVSSLYFEGDEWYTAQLSRHINKTLALDPPVYRRSSR